MSRRGKTRNRLSQLRRTPPFSQNIASSITYLDDARADACEIKASRNKVPGSEHRMTRRTTGPTRVGRSGKLVLQFPFTCSERPKFRRMVLCWLSRHDSQRVEMGRKGSPRFIMCDSGDVRVGDGIGTLINPPLGHGPKYHVGRSTGQPWHHPRGPVSWSRQL